MELSCNLRTNYFPQPTLVRGVDVLVSTGLNLKFVGPPFLKNLVEAVLDRYELVLGKDSSRNVGSSKGDRAGNILGEEGAIEVDGFVIGHH